MDDSVFAAIRESHAEKGVKLEAGGKGMEGYVR